MSTIRSVMNHPNYNKIFRKEKECEHPVEHHYTFKDGGIICWKCMKVLKIGRKLKRS